MMFSELIRNNLISYGFQGSCETAERLHGHMHLLPSFTGNALALGPISMAGTASNFVETECVIEAYGPDC